MYFLHVINYVFDNGRHCLKLTSFSASDQMSQLSGYHLFCIQETLDSVLSPEASCPG